jgi:hypothetical protein
LKLRSTSALLFGGRVDAPLSSSSSSLLFLRLPNHACATAHSKEMTSARSSALGQQRRVGRYCSLFRDRILMGYVMTRLGQQREQQMRRAVHERERVARELGDAVEQLGQRAREQLRDLARRLVEHLRAAGRARR